MAWVRAEVGNVVVAGFREARDSGVIRTGTSPNAPTGFGDRAE